MDRRKKGFFILFCLMIAAVSVYPYFTVGVNIEHDTCFHLSRIDALAQSIREGDLLPRIFPYQNNGFGYASPLFYSNLFLLFPAMLVNAGMSLANSYQLFLFVVSALTAYIMGICVYKVFRNEGAALLSGCLYLFSLYRLTDVYVRGALGEVLAFVFLPAALYGIYEVILDDPKEWPWLCAGFSGLLLCHNLSFLMMVLVFFLVILFCFKRLVHQRERILAVVRAALWSLGLCSFFLWPMLEQLTSQTLTLHSFASGFDLDNYALNAWQFTEQSLNFATSGVDFEPGEAMTTNLGFLIPALPLLNFFILEKPEEKQGKLLKWMAWIGYGSYFLCSRLFPWDWMSPLRIIQFPWRLMAIADLMLVPLAAVTAERFFHKQRDYAVPVLICLALMANVVRLAPVAQRPFLFGKEASHDILLDGSFIDPYYGNSTFVRTEIAGADYLPADSVDFRTASRCVVDPDGREIACQINRKGTRMEARISNLGAYTEMKMPLTYYKGYQCWIQDEQGNRFPCEVKRSDPGSLVQVSNGNILNGKVIVEYTGTRIQHVSGMISILSVILLLLTRIKQRKRL